MKGNKVVNPSTLFSNMRNLCLFPEALVNELVSDTAFQVLFIECPVEQLGRTEPPPLPHHTPPQMCTH